MIDRFEAEALRLHHFRTEQPTSLLTKQGASSIQPKPAPNWRHAIAPGTVLVLVLIHIFGERLAGMRDAPASRSAGILPALANEEGKAGTLAAILSHPIGWWARRPPSLTRRWRGISDSQPSQSDMISESTPRLSGGWGRA